MTEFTSAQLSLCLILALKVTVIKQSSSSVIVREGDEILLACGNTMGPISCLRIHWLVSKSSQAPAVDLVKFGQTNQTQAAREKADRLRVSSNCSLIIQRVSAADVGTYYCQQVQNRGQKETMHTVALSLVNITEEKDDEEVTLKCSVIPNEPCKHTVNWLYNGKNIDNHNIDMETKYSVCAAEVTFKTSHYVYEPGRYNSLRCEVESEGRKQRFPFTAQTPGKKNKRSENDEAEQPSGRWWLYIVVVVVLAAFLLAVGIFMKRKKNKGNKTGVSSPPVASRSASEVNQDPDEPDATVSYASINLPKKNNNQVRGSDAAVTYSAVRIGVSPDPSHLYASVK